MTTHAAPRKTGWMNYWAWGSGDMLGAGAMAVISGWLFYFYTTFCNLSAGEAGLILGIPRLVDAVSCPLIGYFSDNLRHTWIGRRIGRRKIFLLIAIPLLPSFALMFVTGHGFAYYLTTFIFFEVVYASVLIPWETLAAEMTSDYKAKARFAGARMLVAQASAVLASYLPTLIINALGGKDAPDTFLIMAAIFGGIFSAVVLLVVLFTWERPYTDAEFSVRRPPASLANVTMIPVNMFRDMFSTLRLRAFRQHLSIYLGGYISQDIFNTAFPIFVITVMMGATLVISQLMTIMYLFQFVSVIIAINMVMRLGPVVAYRTAISLVIAACVLFFAFYLIQPEGFTPALKAVETNMLGAILSGSLSGSVVFWLLVPLALAGLGRGTLNFVPWSVYNYLPDIDEAVTGKRREGIFAGVMTLVRKLTQSLALTVTGFAMQAGGYQSGAAPQTEGAIHTVIVILVAAPIIIMLLGAVASWKFRLNGETHAVLIREVERLRAGATRPETEESGRVVEDLTGWKYDQLWGRGKQKAVESAVMAPRAV
ncbi:MAG: transporter [Proteobacteria bacterium]|nr:transporter [Pseudomonadota bacterium]